MSAASLAQAAPPTTRQHGAVAAEFALVLMLLLLLMFGVLELARLMYMFNAIQMAARRAAHAAVNADFSDQAAMATVRQTAIFRASPGGLPLGAPITDAYVRIDYMAQLRSSDGTLANVPIAPANLPACPASNRLACMTDPYDASCISLVRVRICDPATADTCTPARYQTLFSFIPLPVNLPTAPVIIPAQALGFVPGTPPCR